MADKTTHQPNMEPDSKALPANPPSIHNNVFRAEIENVHQERAETSTTMPAGYGRNVRTVDDYRHPARACFSWRNLDAFNPFNTGGNKALLCRRICMITILVIRTLSSIISLLMFNWTHHKAEGIIKIILTVIGFFFMVWCLATIGNMRGQRRLVRNVIVGRWHYDVFLATMFVAHVGLLIGVVLGIPGAGGFVMWVGLLLLMWGAAWVATWPAVDGSAV